MMLVGLFWSGEEDYYTATTMRRDQPRSLFRSPGTDVPERTRIITQSCY